MPALGDAARRRLGSQQSGVTGVAGAHRDRPGLIRPDRTDLASSSTVTCQTDGLRPDGLRQGGRGHWLGTT